jgi:hypothetical protein
MVVGNTGDPATPYEGSKVMAESLEEGFFVSVEANTHTGIIDSYLVDLTIPDPAKSC